MANKPGWYPDPNDPRKELYWDGSDWHGSRDKMAAAISTPKPQLQGNGAQQIGQRLREVWAGLNTTWRVVVIIGTIVVLGLVGNVFSEVFGDGKVRRTCTELAEAEGFGVQEIDPVVDACVDYYKKFGRY